jgi:hypothetical protein
MFDPGDVAACFADRAILGYLAAASGEAGKMRVADTSRPYLRPPSAPTDTLKTLYLISALPE